MPTPINYLGQELGQGQSQYRPPQQMGMQGAPPPFDINALLAAFAHMQQQQGQTQLQGQREFLQSQQPQHLGIGGGAIDPQTGREAGNAFDNGFFKTPQQRQQVIDQRSVGMPGVSSLQTNPYFQSQGMGAEDAFQASPQAFHPSPFSFQMPQPLTTPFGTPQTDQRNLQQNKQMYRPGAARKGSSFGF